MNDFLNQVFLDNTIRSYLIVTVVILFVLILKQIISRYFAVLIYRLVRLIWKDVDKKLFSGMVSQPLGLFLLIWVSIIELQGI